MAIKQLEGLGELIFNQRYANGNENWAQRSRAIAKHAASAETDSEKDKWEKKFFEVVGSGDLIPGGRIIYGSGRSRQNMLNCYAITPDDSVASIAKTIADAYKISCGGGGIGFSFSKIRPKGDDIQNIKFSAPGSVSVIKMINEIGSHVKAGKNRRTALIAILHVEHPDILEFLHVKLDKKELNNFNISVAITDDFIDACKTDKSWVFKFGNKNYYVYQVDRISKTRETINIVATSIEDALGRADSHFRLSADDTFENVIKFDLKARDLWNKLWENAVETGCPGIYNHSLINKFTNVSYFETLDQSNPCLFGSTLVACADGKADRTIEELAISGDDVKVYCLDTRKDRVTIRTLRSPRKTGTKVPTYKVTLEDGNSIICTDNHRWILSDKSEKQTKDLIEGDSLALMTKFEAEFVEAIPTMKKTKSQDYMWLDYKGKIKSEHRLIAEATYDSIIPGTHVVHHIDFNALNNKPENLQVLTHEDHNKLHTQNMLGDKNPMRRAHLEWSPEKWDSYRTKMSKSTSGEKNGRFLGASNEDLKTHALQLTKRLGRLFSTKEWTEYAKSVHIPSSFSQWRKNHFNGVKGLAKWAATTLGFVGVDADPRVSKTYLKYLDIGYDCEIIDGKCVIIKTCEKCSKEFKIEHVRKEVAFCSVPCSVKQSMNSEKVQKYAREQNNASLKLRKERDREQQLSVYTELKQKLGRVPFKKEWEAVCRERKFRYRVGKHSVFDKYSEVIQAGNNFNHRISKVEFHGYEDVYNGTVDEFHNFFVGGFKGNSKFNKPQTQYLLNLQCGELPLPSYGNCCLGNINLSNMVDNGQVDWKKLANTVRLGIRFLDNILTANYFPVEECREVGHRSRRIGLGVMGLHYMLIKLGIRYGDDKCLELLERLFATIRNEAYLTSMYLSEEKGTFPSFDAEKYLNEEFSKTLPARIRMLIRKNGIRNAVMLTIPPTGTISMVHETSSGLEPIFAPIYLRRFREANVWREVPVVDPLLKSYYLSGVEVERLKHLFVGAYDITPSEHMAVQATIQRFTDSSLSKTINLPSTAQATDFADLALEYAPYLKGMTVYRAASKENEPLSVIPLTKENLDKYIGFNSVKTESSSEEANFCAIGDGSCGS